MHLYVMFKGNYFYMKDELNISTNLLSLISVVEHNTLESIKLSFCIIFRNYGTYN